MYNVSEGYRQAIRASTRKSTIIGTLTTKSGTVYPLNDATFLKNTFYTTNKCVNGSALEFGSVYAGECGFSIISNIDRYTLFGAEINVRHELTLADESKESLELGTYYVDSAVRTGKVIKITALDRMSDFDIEVDEDTNGFWIDVLKYIAEKIGIELAQTDEELLALHVNTAEMYTIRQERVQTYRDALAYLAMIVCTFATIDRFGKLRLVPFGTVAVDTNNEDTRLNGCSFDDYTTKYGSVRARFVAEENYYPYYSENPDRADDLTLDMGDIPIVGGLPEAKQIIMDNILATVEQFEYVPSNLYIASNPAYELGDLIQCDNVNRSNASVNTYVMNYKFEYRLKESVKCYGENPKLQNVSDGSKRELADMEISVSAQQMFVTTYTNAGAYSIKQEAKSVVDFDYSAFKNCNPVLLATIPFTLDTDGYVEFTMFNGLVQIDDLNYTEYYTAGKHFATITFTDSCNTDERRSLRVFARAYRNEESKERVQDAKIATIYNFMDAVKTQNLDIVTALADEDAVLPITTLSDVLVYDEVAIDTTEPTMTIDKNQIHACLYAQGLNGKGEWDGTLEFMEMFDAIVGQNTGVVPFTDTLISKSQLPQSRGFTENMAAIIVPSVQVEGFSENLTTVEE